MTRRTNTPTNTPRRTSSSFEEREWLNGGTEGHDGAWRSSVARLLWEQEVPGSNPGAPTR